MMRRVWQIAFIGLAASAVVVLGAWSSTPTELSALRDIPVLEPLLPAPAGDGTPAQGGAAAEAPDDGPGTDEPATQPSRLNVSSARIEDRVIERSLQPVGLEIQRLGIAAPVVRAGAGVDGAMEVPESIDEVAWYEFGPSPGEQGSAVLAAHVDMAGLGPGVFFDLHALEPGDLVTVSFEDGTESTFEVFEAHRYLKEELDTGRIFARSGEPTLTLVTCGGAFNPSLGRYDSNVVVYAGPVGAVDL